MAAIGAPVYVPPRVAFAEHGRRRGNRQGAAGELDRVVRIGRERPVGDRVGTAGHRLAGRARKLSAEDCRGGVVELEAAGGVGQGRVGRAEDLRLGLRRDGQRGRSDGKRAAGEGDRIVAIGGERALGDGIAARRARRPRCRLARARAPVNTVAAVSSIATPSTVVSTSPVGVTVKADRRAVDLGLGIGGDSERRRGDGEVLPAKVIV